MSADAAACLSVELCVPGPRDAAGAGGGSSGSGSLPVEVNATEGIPFENAFFRGRVLLLNRPDPETADWPYHKHFTGKLRRFEFRLQGTFLADPGQNVFFGVELAERVGLGPALRLTVNWLVGVVNVLCTARGVSYSYNLELAEQADGSVVRPYLAFALVAADAIVVTPQGGAPPSLTESLEPMSAQEKSRVRLNTTDTFTFAYWSKQADFVRWEMCNLPFGWRSGLANFIGRQPVHLTAYRLEPGGASELHSEDRKTRLMALVLTNRRAQAAEPGPEAAAAAAANEEPAARPWVLEEAELSLEEYLLLEGRPGAFVTKPRGRPQPPASPPKGWLSSLGCCASTVTRHGVK